MQSSTSSPELFVEGLHLLQVDDIGLASKNRLVLWLRALYAMHETVISMLFEEQVELILQKLESLSSDTICHFLGLARYVPCRVSEKCLSRCVLSGQRRVRNTALISLKTWSGLGVVMLCVAALMANGDTDPRLQDSVARRLAEQDDSEMIESLSELLKQPSE